MAGIREYSVFISELSQRLLIYGPRFVTKKTGVPVPPFFFLSSSSSFFNAWCERQDFRIFGNDFLTSLGWKAFWGLNLF